MKTYVNNEVHTCVKYDKYGNETYRYEYFIGQYIFGKNGALVNYFEFGLWNGIKLRPLSKWDKNSFIDDSTQCNICYNDYHISNAVNNNDHPQLTAESLKKTNQRVIMWCGHSVCDKCLLLLKL